MGRDGALVAGRGTEHSRTMLATEISYLGPTSRRSVVTSDPAQFAKRFADNTYHYLFEVTRFVDFIHWVSPPPAANEQDSDQPCTRSANRQRVRDRDDAGYPAILGAAGDPHPGDAGVSAVRPGGSWSMDWCSGSCVDGVGTREFVYLPLCQKAALPLVVITWVVYLALPFSLHPTFIVLPFAAMFALVWR